MRRLSKRAAVETTSGSGGNAQQDDFCEIQEVCDSELHVVDVSLSRRARTRLAKRHAKRFTHGERVDLEQAVVLESDDSDLEVAQVENTTRSRARSRHQTLCPCPLYSLARRSSAAPSSSSSSTTAASASSSSTNTRHRSRSRSAHRHAPTPSSPLGSTPSPERFPTGGDVDPSSGYHSRLLSVPLPADNQMPRESAGSEAAMPSSPWPFSVAHEESSPSLPPPTVRIWDRSSVTPSTDDLSSGAEACFYVEVLRREMAPLCCSACESAYRVGQIRVGYTPDSGHLVSPKWIHASCIGRANLNARPGVDSVCFSPTVPFRERDRILESLSRHSRSRRERSTYVQRWSYLPARVQHWVRAYIPMPPPRSPTQSQLGALQQAQERLRQSIQEASDARAIQVHGMLTTQNVAPHEIDASAFGHAMPWGMFAEALQDGSILFVPPVDHPPEAPAPPPALGNGAIGGLANLFPAERLRQNVEEKCAICREAMCAGELIRRLPCLHMYHVDCIDQWFKVRTTCPLCNLRIEDLMERSAAHASTSASEVIND